MDVVWSEISLGAVSNIDWSYKMFDMNKVHVSTFAVAWAGMTQAESELQRPAAVTASHICPSLTSDAAFCLVHFLENVNP